jgi:polygalacturonase
MLLTGNSRRAFLKTLAAGAVVTPIAGAADGWAMVPSILARIQPPKFPDRDFDIAKYGAAANGEADCTDAFRRAIEACARAGGGRVLVPAGKFSTGAVHLKSNVNLHVSAGATVLFSTDPKKYPSVLTRWEGTECINYSPLIYAFEQENIAVTGVGVLDGQAGNQHWWPWKGKADFGWTKGDPSQQKDRDMLVEMAAKGVPVDQRVFGAGHLLRPQFVQPYRCKNVLIEGVTIRNSPMWEIHPVLCRNVTVKGVKIASHGPNNDGCDPESCTDVLIKDCLFDTGDDCIALKSGRNEDGRRLNAPCENVVIQGCQMKDGHGGVTIGSEVSGSARNVFAEDCTMDSPNLDRVLRLKTNAVRGGTIENIYMRNVTVGQISDAVIQVDFFYEEADKGSFKPIVRNVEMRNVVCGKSKYALYLRGFKDAPITDVRLEHCVFENVAKPDVLENVKGLKFSGVVVNGKTIG